MILARRELFSEIRKGRISITPFEEKNIGPCSIDLRLGNVFRRFKKSKKTIEVSEKPDYLKEYSKLIEIKNNKKFVIKPNELVLGITKEKIRLSSCFCGWIQGRSRFARMGLMVHVSASLIQPGVDNVQVLEIVNLSPVSLAVTPGTRICQVVFERLSSSAAYTGPFQYQKIP